MSSSCVWESGPTYIPLTGAPAVSRPGPVEGVPEPETKEVTSTPQPDLDQVSLEGFLPVPRVGRVTRTGSSTGPGPYTLVVPKRDPVCGDLWGRGDGGGGEMKKKGRVMVFRGVVPSLSSDTPVVRVASPESTVEVGVVSSLLWGSVETSRG